MLPVKEKEINNLNSFTYISNFIQFYKFCNSKRHQTNFTLQINTRVNITRETFIIYALFCLIFVSHFSLGRVYQWLFQTDFCTLGRQKKWLLVTLDRWLSYTVTIVWEFPWAYSALVVLGKWLSYRGGCLNRFDCIRRVKTWIFLNEISILDFAELAIFHCI